MIDRVGEIQIPNRDKWDEFVSKAELRVCPSCGKEKKVLPKTINQYIYDWDDIIHEGGNTHLKDEKYHPLCVRCLHEAIRSDLKVSLISVREEKGEPIPRWLKEF